MTSGLTWDANCDLQVLSPDQHQQREITDLVYTTAAPTDFKINRFASEKNLGRVWNYVKETGGQAPGSDEVRFEDVTGSQFKEAVRLACQSIKSETYRLRPIRAVHIPKPDGSRRELSLQCIMDRVISKAFLLTFSSYWRRRLPRYGKSVLDLFAQLNRDVRQHGKYILAVDDIRNCFPSTPLDRVLQCQMEVFAGTQAEYLARQIILGHEGQDLTGGVGQGSPYSPVAVECLLHTLFDTALESSSQQTHLYRYVDNMRWCRFRGPRGLLV